MPTAHTVYVCDLCDGRWPTLAEAERCEAKGPAPVYPRGLLFGDNRRDVRNMRADQAFAVAENVANSHVNYFLMWAGSATRDELDVFPPAYMAHCHRGNLGPDDTHLDPAHPAVQRLAEALHARGIPPTVWTAAGPVAFETWCRQPREAPCPS